MRKLSLLLVLAAPAGFLVGGCGSGAASTSASVASTTNFGPTLTTPTAPVAASSAASTSDSIPTNATGNQGTGSAPPPSGPVKGSGGSKGATKTVTITNTVTTAVNVPRGAQLPSAVAPLALSSFQALGGNIGCRLGGGTARCDISKRIWPPPAKPSSCAHNWGQGLEVGPDPAQFVCANDSTLDPSGPAVPIGDDDTVGSVTCQVRSFGVTCFDAGGSGFFLARTGYAIF
jgi:hypothetical protein